jgi:hypothetical protein
LYNVQLKINNNPISFFISDSFIILEKWLHPYSFTTKPDDALILVNFPDKFREFYLKTQGGLQICTSRIVIRKL